MKNKKGREAMGRQAQKRFTDHFHIASVAEKIKIAYGNE